MEDSRKMKMVRCLALLAAARENVIVLSDSDKDYIKDVLQK